MIISPCKASLKNYFFPLLLGLVTSDKLTLKEKYTYGKNIFTTILAEDRVQNPARKTEL